MYDPSDPRCSLRPTEVFRNSEDHKRECAYCGKVGNNTTKEHVIPKWVSVSFGAQGNKSRFTSINTSSPTISRVVGSAPNTATVRKLCDKCQAPWSKDIVDRASDIIKRIHGRQTRLSVVECKALTRQAILTFMNREFLDPANQITAFDTRKAFRESEAPLQSFRVWAALMPDGAEIAWNQFSKTSMLARPDLGYNVPLSGMGSLIFGIKRLILYVEHVAEYVPGGLHSQFRFSSHLSGLRKIGPNQVFPVSLLKATHDQLGRAAWKNVRPESVNKFVPITVNLSD
jgi:hypothetical protein